MHYRNEGEITALALALIANGEPHQVVARETDISAPYLSQCKNGTREPSPKAAKRLAYYLQLPEAVVAKGRVSASWLYAVLERIGTFPKADG